MMASATWDTYCIVTRALKLMKSMANKACLPYFSWRNQCNIAPISQGRDDLFSLFSPIKEIARAFITLINKGIL